MKSLSSLAGVALLRQLGCGVLLSYAGDGAAEVTLVMM
jgi:hypothetical protein